MTARETYVAARARLIGELGRLGWTTRPALKVPWAESPDGRAKLWFKAQAVYQGAHTLGIDIRGMNVQTLLAVVQRRLDYRDPYGSRRRVMGRRHGDVVGGFKAVVIERLGSGYFVHPDDMKAQGARAGTRAEAWALARQMSGGRHQIVERYVVPRHADARRGGLVPPGYYVVGCKRHAVHIYEQNVKRGQNQARICGVCGAPARFHKTKDQSQHAPRSRRHGNAELQAGRFYGYKGHRVWLDQSPGGGWFAMIQGTAIEARAATQAEAMQKIRAKLETGAANYARRARRARFGNASRGRMTIAQAKAILRPLGITLNRRPEWNEYRVNFLGAGEGPAYYTDDLEDAVATGRSMAQHRAANYADRRGRGRR